MQAIVFLQVFRYANNAVNKILNTLFEISLIQLKKCSPKNTYITGSRAQRRVVQLTKDYAPNCFGLSSSGYFINIALPITAKPDVFNHHIIFLALG